MFWRLLSALILCFWAVMTAMLVQRTYFAPEVAQAIVSPQLVMQSFAKHQAGLNTLQLTRGKEKLGQGTFAVQPWVPAGEAAASGYTLHAGGMMDGKTLDADGGNVSWRFEGDFDREQHWHRLDLRLRIAATDTAIIFSWHGGDEQPLLEVMREGKTIMDLQSAMAQGAAAQGITGFGSMALLPGMNSKATLQGLVQLSGYESHISIAGTSRHCLVLKVSVMGFYEAKAFFTDSGELARIDLPNGYQFIDPLLSGLEP